MLNFDWINGLDIHIAKMLVMLAFIIPLVFALTLKKSYIYAGAADKKIYRNLKIWVMLLSIIMLLIYSSF